MKNVYEVRVGERTARARWSASEGGWIGSVYPEPLPQTETIGGIRQPLYDRMGSLYGPHPDRFCALAAAINRATDDVELRRAARAEAGIH